MRSRKSVTVMLQVGVLFVWVPTVVLAALQDTTVGSSGPLCGTSRCLGQGQAACVNGECVCQGSNVKGLGNFVCLRKDEEYAVIFNDPMVQGFDQSHAKIPLVCKFLAAHISTTACTGGDPDNVVTSSGMCDLRLFAWGRRKMGKTFIRGIQVNVMLLLGNATYFHATRVETEAVNGVYTYTEDGNTNPFGAPPFGDPVRTDVPGLGRIHTVYDRVDNFARVIVEPCGIEVGIRGVEQIGHSLQQPPGMYIKVLEACEPRYLSNDKVIFSPPAGHGPSLIEKAREVSNTLGFTVTPAMVAVYRAFTGQQMQDFPGAPIEIQMLADTVQECDQATVYQALKLCLFAIDRPKFFKCFDNTGDSSVATGLLDECIFSICDSNPFMCQNVQDKSVPCGSRLRPDETSILQFDCGTLI